MRFTEVLLQHKGQGGSTDSRDDKQHKNIYQIYTASVNHVFDSSHMFFVKISINFRELQELR